MLMNKNNTRIKKWLGAFAGVTGAVAAVNYIVMRHAQKYAPLQELNENAETHYYHWICGYIHYTKTGHGRPILLIHNLHPASAGYEWEKVIPIIAGSRTVYTLDLMGCGLSKKTNIIYTNFFYMQLIKDFIRDVICEKTDVATIGDSSSFVVSACASDGNLFNRLILIAPGEPKCMVQSTANENLLRRLIIQTPVFGTLLYNIEFSKLLLKFKLENFDFANKSACTPEILNTCYYHAHLHGNKAKSLFSSYAGGYLNIDISKMLQHIDHEILIIIGRNSFSAKDVIKNYRKMKPSVDTKIINNTKNLIPMENHLAVANAILNYVSV